MKKFLVVLMFIAWSSFIHAKIHVSKPESLTLTTRHGLILEFSNQLEGLPNNDAVAYLVVSGSNKSQGTVKISPEDFVLKDLSGKVIQAIPGNEALKAVVDWNFEKAVDYIRIGDSDLHDVLRNENRRFTDKALTEIILKPHERLKEKLLFFPRLVKGEYTLEFGIDKVQMLVADGLYFVRPEDKGKLP